MNIINHRIIFYTISGLLVLASIIFLFVFGLALGRDFIGGALWEIRYHDNPPAVEELTSILRAKGEERVLIQPTESSGFIIRLPDISEERHQNLFAALREAQKKNISGNQKSAAPIVEELRFDSIGPVVGAELRRKALIALALAVGGIIFYIAWAFRKVSKPISSWLYGIIAIVALLHDILIPVGVFAYLKAEIDMLFVSALLTILGFSVHDTIVVFDRVRENLRKGGPVSPKQEQGGDDSFATLVNRSVNETLVRSLNTSLTVVMVLGVVLFLGGESTFYFVLALLIGIVAGTYSSIFIASPLLVTIERFRRKS